MGKFVIRLVNSGVKFDLRASNGQNIATSEVYETRVACLRGLESVRKNAPKAKLEDRTQEPVRPATNPKFEIYQDRSGEYRFRLKARNGAIIAVSNGYTAKGSCLAGIESVRANAPDAEVEET